MIVGSLFTDLSLKVSTATDFTVTLPVGSYANSAAVEASLQSDGTGGAVLPLASGHSVHFIGLDPTSLGAGRFLFG